MPQIMIKTRKILQLLSLIPNHQKFGNFFFSPNNTPWRQSIYFMKKDCTQANKFDWLNKGHELPN